MNRSITVRDSDLRRPRPFVACRSVMWLLAALVVTARVRAAGARRRRSARTAIRRTLPHVTDSPGTGGEQDCLLSRHAEVPQLEPTQVLTAERAEKHVATPCRETIPGVDGQA